MRITTSEVAYIDGARVLIKGEEPKPLCSVCPYRDDPNAPIRHIEVVPYTGEEPTDPSVETYP
jgi:hypothetical protein